MYPWSSLPRRAPLLLLTSAVLLGASAAHAEPSAAEKETARSLLDEGDKAFESKDYAGALKAYAAADGLMHVPTTGVEVARAQEALGKLVEAKDTCLAVSRSPSTASEPASFKTARTRCSEMAASLSARIPSLVIDLVAPEAEKAIVTCDGDLVPSAMLGLPRKMNPGAHEIIAKGAGYLTTSQVITLPPGATTRAKLELKRDPAAIAAAPAPTPAPAATPAAAREPAKPATAPPPPAGGGLPTYAWAGFGVGAAGLVVGSIAGIVTLSRASDVKPACTNGVCPGTAGSDLDSAKTMANVSNIGFGVAIVGGAVGLVGLLTRPSGPSTKSAAATPYVTPTGAGLQGRF